MRRRVASALIAAVLLALFWRGASLQSRAMNLVREEVDQSAYLDQAKQMRLSHYEAVTSRNRMPLYPLLLSLLFRPAMTDAEFFDAAKVFNIFLSMAALLGFYFLFRRMLSEHASVNLTLIAAFDVFLFKAPFVQCEVLFYFLNFSVFLLLLKFLKRPAASLAVAAGVVAGLAYLTKASVMPALLIFSAACAGKASKKMLLWVPAALVFLAVIFPYSHTSKKIFGRYFYNVNSTYVMWHDSWDEAKDAAVVYDSPDVMKIPEAELPGFRKYRSEHTWRQMRGRLWYGVKLLVIRSARAYGYFEYAAATLALFLVMALLYKRRFLEFLQANRIETAFVVFYFLGGYLLFSWYAAIDFGPRFVLAQFVPFMFALNYAMEKIEGPPIALSANRRLRVLTSFNWVVTAAVFADIVIALRHKVFVLFGGT